MKEGYYKIFESHGFNFSRLIGGSKTLYRRAHPEHDIVFNARIYLLEDYQNNPKMIKDFCEGQKIEIWYGDLDLTLDREELKKVQKEIGITIVITTEHGHIRDTIPSRDN